MAEETPGFMKSTKGSGGELADRTESSCPQGQAQGLPGSPVGNVAGEAAVGGGGDNMRMKSQGSYGAMRG